MALSGAVKGLILSNIVGNFVKVYLSDSVSTIPLGSPIANISSTLIGGERTLSWGTATSTSVTTTNSATSNPINYSVPQNKSPRGLVIINSSNTIVCDITLPTPLPSYSSGDGPYYVRGITLNLTEV